MTIQSWDEHIKNPAAKTDSATLQETTAFIFGMFTDKHAWKIDFRHLTKVAVNGEHLAMALRCTATRQKWITGWYGALEKAKTALMSEGKDPEDALYGLLAATRAAEKLPISKYLWFFKCIQNNLLICTVIFSTPEDTYPIIGEVYSKLLALKKVPSQGHPLISHFIEPIGWSHDIPHITEP